MFESKAKLSHFNLKLLRRFAHIARPFRQLNGQVHLRYQHSEHTNTPHHTMPHHTMPHHTMTNQTHNTRQYHTQIHKLSHHRTLNCSTPHPPYHATLRSALNTPQTLLTRPHTTHTLQNIHRVHSFSRPIALRNFS